jgi:hypothetical protein
LVLGGEARLKHKNNWAMSVPWLKKLEHDFR